MKVLGFVFGIVALVLGWLGAIPFIWWIGIVLVVIAILGIVFSAMAMSKAKKAGEKNGLAVAGLVLAIIGLVEALICTIVGVFAMAAFNVLMQNGGQQLTTDLTNQLQKALDSIPTPS